MKQSSRASNGACAAAAACLAIVSTAANGGFLDDFYGNSGNYQGNLTKPGFVQSNTLNTVTGGSFVYKTPRAQFTPFFVTPPSLKTGCGGIDLMLGSFSLPSQQEFVAFLRNIGQSLPGLAFELALQSMSPELAQQVAEYKNMLMKLSQNSTDACQAASDLLKFTGADAKLKEVVQDAENWGRSSGLFSDQAAAKKEVSTNGQKAIDTVQPTYNSNGDLVDGPEINIVWAMLNMGRMSVTAPQELKELMMSLIGTWITRRQGQNEDQVLYYDEKPSQMNNYVDFIGTVGSPTMDPSKLRYYKCDEYVKCLNPSPEAYADKSFANRVYVSALAYRDAIISRNQAMIDFDGLYMLASSSSIPLLRIVNATALNRFQGFGADIIAVYSEAVAYEMFLNYLDQLATDTERSVSTAKDGAVSALVATRAKEINERLAEIRRRVKQEGGQLYAKMNATSSFIAQIDQIERSLKGNLAADLAANMRFASKN